MTSRKLNFDEETKQFIALYTNIKGEEIEKIFTRQQADKTFKEIIKFWKDVDQLSIRERMTQRAEYMEGTKRRFEWLDFLFCVLVCVREGGVPLYV
jgi:hypothetical protein